MNAALQIHPVRQTLFGGNDAAPHERGNCFPACLASLLGMPLENVPHFYGELWQGDNESSWKAILQWVQTHGASIISWDWPLSDSMREHLVGSTMIFSGYSPRFAGTSHAVLGRVTADGWELVHDPHPDDLGLVGEPYMVELVFPQYRRAGEG